MTNQQNTTVDLNQKIRSVIPWVISNYKTKPEQCHEVMYCIISELETDKSSHAIIKLYINYYLCELIINYVDENEVKNFLVTVFPTPLNLLGKNFLEQLLSLSICLNNKPILNALTFYIENNEIKINENEIKSFPDDLSNDCPEFVSTLINKGFFFNNKNSKLYTTTLLNTWLSGLNENCKKMNFDGQQLIKFVLYNDEECSSLLHYNLLEIIQKNLVINLNANYFFELVEDLNNLKDNEKQMEKFSQILIVSLQNKCVKDFTQKTKKELIKKMPKNSLLEFCLKS